ncbi:MAG: HAMP domain-containing protein [Gammaproteobacteria bacterium]|nr:HAMP domain-containing protein [Gammaproteobacteria bacterium]
MKRYARGIWPMLALFVLLLVSLSFMSDATHNSEQFGRLYSLLLLTNALGLVVLIGLIGANLYWLLMQYRRRAAGARLTSRLVIMFVVLAVVPVSVVYYFSLQFLQRGIDSWFNVQIEASLEDAIELSQSAFDVRLRDMLHLTKGLAGELTEVPSALAPLSLYDLRVRSGAIELTLIGANGRIIASSGTEATEIIPDRPTDAVLLQARQGQSYVGLDPVGDELHVRAVVPVPTGGPSAEPRILQALYAVPERLNAKADRVQNAFARYKELAYLRVPLKHSYTLTLSLVLLLSLLSAVWGAFYAARRLVAPIRDLAEGTRAVADGDYSQQLPVTGHDELGFLVQSFNVMTRRLAYTRDEADRSQQQVEGQRTYLAALLANISSGVISLAPDLRVRMLNDASAQILGLGAEECTETALEALAQQHHVLQPLVDTVLEQQRQNSAQWTAEITLFGSRGRQVLICRATTLPGDDIHPGGLVLVLDDITALIQAQRDAAWGEVARRLAHEIKNPLTPIQLSAERLRRKFLDRMTPEDAEILDRSTHTIVQQVETMKEMVNAFSEYARAPQIQLQVLDLNRLVREVLDLYRGGRGHPAITAELDPAAPRVEADTGRLRQLLHNLIKNAQEALADTAEARIRVTTRVICSADEQPYVELAVQDNGAGFSAEMLAKLFEPYVTTKTKGTGLGLAIVKKIVEEHGGIIQAENAPEGGALICIRLRPAAASPDGHRTGA